MSQNPWCESDKKVPFATTFEDNFTSESAEKLPDSKEYIERLEKKLNNLKVNSSITKQLAERREECMEKLLIGAIELSSDSEDSDLKPASKLIRRIVPEQPLTAGELVNLLGHISVEAPPDSHEDLDEAQQTK